jgi:uncharacterized membrane protein (DUF4010 family)
MELNEYHKLALAVALGLLVGLQRERQEDPIAGIRTFALITLMGALAGLLAPSFGAWVVAASFLAVAAVIVVGNVARHRHGPADPGVTTEIAALVMFAVGALLMTQQEGLAIAVAGAAAVLIYSKEPLHKLAGRLGDKDLRAISRLVLLGMVILPLMPNEAYGPYDVINPFKIWLLVVLIVGISLGAYLAYVFLGPRVGTVLGGILGGLISSTATTVSYARRTRGNPELAPAATLVILLASTIVFARVLVEISVAAPGHVMRLAPPIVALMAFMLVLCAVVYAVQRGRMAQAPEHEPPSNLKAAIFFGLLYAAVLVAVAWAKENFGTQGLYIVAALSGMTDMDAITLSTSQLVQQGSLPPEVGWRAILIGSMANLVFKALAVAALGHVRLLAAVAGLFLLAGAAGVSLLVFWPA